MNSNMEAMKADRHQLLESLRTAEAQLNNLQRLAMAAEEMELAGKAIMLRDDILLFIKKIESIDPAAA